MSDKQLLALTEHDRSVATTAIRAMHAGQCLSILYHPQGKPDEGRIVEVHAVGLSHKGHPVMRVWQVSGGTVFGEKTGWKLLSLDDADKPAIIDVKSEGPRPGYAPGDKGMSAIVAEISNVAVPKD